MKLQINQASSGHSSREFSQMVFMWGATMGETWTWTAPHACTSQYTWAGSLGQSVGKEMGFLSGVKCVQKHTYANILTIVCAETRCVKMIKRWMPWLTKRSLRSFLSITWPSALRSMHQMRSRSSASTLTLGYLFDLDLSTSRKGAGATDAVCS